MRNYLGDGHQIFEAWGGWDLVGKYLGRERGRESRWVERREKCVC